MLSALAVLRLMERMYLVGPLYWKVGWLLALEDAINVRCRPPGLVDIIIRNQATTRRDHIAIKLDD